MKLPVDFLSQNKLEETHVAIGTDDSPGSTVVTPVSNGPQSASTRSNHSNTNGSIITMTLKNNHLIVEKEERSVSAAAFIMRDCSKSINKVPACFPR